MFFPILTLSITMKPPTSKQLARQEKKKKSLAALAEIARLNDKDRAARQRQDSGSSTSSLTPEQPRRKRKRTDADHSECNISGSDSEESVKVHVEESADANSNNAEPEPAEKVVLTSEQYAALKLELRNRKNRLKQLPRLRLKQMGASASLSVKCSDRIPLFLTDIQHLLMYSILGHHSPYIPSRWCLLEKYNKLSHTVVIIVEGVSVYHFSAYESLFTNITTIFNNRVEVVTPAMYNGRIIEELALVPLTGTQKEKLIKKFGSLEAAMDNTKDLMVMIKAVFPITSKSTNFTENSEKIEEQCELPETDKFPRTKLLLSAWQMVEENYPLPLKGELTKRYTDFILTKDSYQEVTPKSPMFGLDCEMCKTSEELSELTRISLVNEKHEVVYEKLVLPFNKITDYLTKYSGITKHKLENVTTRLPDVQEDLRKMLPDDAILVGQSLNFDLHALKMMHPYCIDTSVIYNITGDRSRKTKLQTLAREFLGERIQQGNKGHDSIEDSTASLKLTQLKLAKSVDFGDSVLNGLRQAEINEKDKKQFATSLFNHVTNNSITAVNVPIRSAAIVGCEEVIVQYRDLISNEETPDELPKVLCLTEPNNKDVLQRVCNISMEHKLTMAHIQIMPCKLEHPKVETTLRTLDKCIERVWSHMAVNGLCVVIFGGQTQASGACFLEVKREATQI